MKCNYCGKELEQGADFCPECGMIISLDGAEPVKDEPAKEEVPEYTPNIFKTIDFEEEEAQPAMELEVTGEEESAPVVEAIPEYVAEKEIQTEQAEIAEPEQAEESANEAEVGFSADEFAPPEYTSELSYLDEVEPEIPDAQDTPEESAKVLFGQEPVIEPQQAEELPGDTIVMSLDEIKNAEADAVQEPEVQLPIEDNSLIEALFDTAIINARNEEIEDITKAHNEKIKKDKKKDSSNKGYATVFALVVVLVGIIFAAGYVVDNVLPKIQGETTTDSAVNGTTEPSSTLPTTTPPASTTLPTTSPTTSGTSTTGTSTTGTSTTGASTTGTSTTGTSTTAPGTSGTTTTRPTTTAPTTRPTTTAPTTTQSSNIKEPSRWNMDAVAYFPTSGSVSLKASPSSSASTVATHPYGYPLYAYASENGYYYVESPYHDHLMAWVSASSLKEYVTTTAPTTTRPTTTAPSTTAPDSDDDGYKAYDKSYSAVIAVDEGLNVRQGPGTGYSINGTIPLGHTVIVYGYSTKVSGWVYVETDSNYPAAALSGWVLEEYLG